MTENILFDLDGTLSNPMIGITKSVQLALRYFHIEVEDLNELTPFIGPPLRDSFMEYYQLSREEAETAVLKYREYFSVTGLYENDLYPGIEELLMHLKASGKTLYVATSKPRIFAERILEHFGIRKYFDEVAGPELDGTMEKKSEVIAYLLETKQLPRTKTIMVGDRKYDIEAAKQLGIDAVGVLYGFGSREELQAAKADYLAETVEELEGYCLLCDQ